MYNLPTVVKVLKHLMTAPEPSLYNDITRAVHEGQVLVDRALAELIGRGVVDMCGEASYHYRATPETDEFCQRLFALYDKVMSRSQKELFVRGLLSQPGPRYLWRISKLLEVLEREGFAREDAIQFLDQETKKGYIRRVKIIFVARISFMAPPFIPYYYMSDFRNVDNDEYEQLKQQGDRLGFAMDEEDYLMGTYPPELSQPAVQYVEKEKRQIRDMLKEEAFRQWQGLTYSW